MGRSFEGRTHLLPQAVLTTHPASPFVWHTDSMSDMALLLARWEQGDRAALDEMLPSIYNELKDLARIYLSRERPDHTLQPTALVHEAYMKLIQQRQVDWRNRAHFLGVAAGVMRRVLLHHAEDRKAQKRSGGLERITLDD